MYVAYEVIASAGLSRSYWVRKFSWAMCGEFARGMLEAAMMNLVFCELDVCVGSSRDDGKDLYEAAMKISLTKVEDAKWNDFL